MRRRMDRPRGEDHLVAAEFGLLALDQRRDTDAAGALEQQLGDLRVGRDRQVRAPPCAGVEIADRGRDAPVIEVGDRDREIAVLVLAVLVVDVVVAGGFERLGDRLGVTAPFVGEDAAHRDAALLAVPGAVEIHVALDLLEIGQHRVPAPALGAARLPFVVIGRRAAIGELAVDRRAAAEHPRLLVFAQGRPLLGPVVRHDLGVDLELGPVEARVEIGGAGVGIEDLRRHVAVGRVLPGLAHQHLVAAPGGQPMRHDRTGRAAADDDVVVDHFPPRSARFSGGDRRNPG